MNPQQHVKVALHRFMEAVPSIIKQDTNQQEIIMGTTIMINSIMEDIVVLIMGATKTIMEEQLVMAIIVASNSKLNMYRRSRTRTVVVVVTTVIKEAPMELTTRDVCEHQVTYL